MPLFMPTAPSISVSIIADVPITGTNWTLTPSGLFLFLGLPEFKATLLIGFSLCL